MAREGVRSPKASRRRLKALLREFPRKRILVLGDLMLDHFIRGKVTRLSPEAPVPVVRITAETFVPGGSGNVCNNLAALGASVSAVGLIGSDAAGSQLLDDLRSRGIDTGSILADGDRRTTQKCRVIADHQQVVRYDRETPHPVGPRTQERLLRIVEEQARRAHALIISDYGKGVVTRRILKTAIAAARRSGIAITVDPKMEHFKRYRGVDCITPNLNEAFSGMRLLPGDGEEDVRKLGLRILKSLRAASVLITRGEKGMTLFESGPSSPVVHIPARAREVFDVTGAGDTVISVLTLAMACGGSILESAVLANIAAGIVVGKLGTATATPGELSEILS